MKLFYFNIREINDFKFNFLYNHSVFFLKSHEIQKINFYKTKKTKTICLISLLLQYYVINKYCHLDLFKIKISKNKYGKPCISNSNFFFNVSHINDYIVIGVSFKCEIGIDIVYLNQNVNISAFKKHFSKKEFNCINNKKQFFIYWALKESFIKAIGSGLSNDLSKINFDIFNLLNIKLFFNNTLKTKWKFNIINFKTNYLISTAFKCN